MKRFTRFKNFQEKKEVQAQVNAITDFGVFCKVDFEDQIWDGLIHISEISDKFVSDITDYIRVGDIITTLLISKDDKLKQLKLSFKKVKKNKKILNSYPLRETGSGFEKLSDYVNKMLEK